MVVFGQMYLAFEKRLTAQVDRLDSRMADIYRMIYIPQMLRTSRLQNDITLLRLRLSHSAVVELDVLTEQSRVFAQRIHDSVNERPAALLAYTWAMYLALFNGGRWIQKQLIAAGSDFWLGVPLPLSFWTFDLKERAGVEEEQLKESLKESFEKAETGLTEFERGAVIKEAILVFDMCREMISLLDSESSTPISPSPSPKTISQPHNDDAAGKTFTGANTVFQSVQVCVTSAYSSLKATASTPWKGKSASTG